MNHRGDHPGLDQLDELLEGALQADDPTAGHVRHCEHCKARLDLLARQGALLRHLGQRARRGPWRGPSAMDRVLDRAREHWLALARLLVLASLRQDPRTRSQLAALPPCLDAADLRRACERLARRLPPGACPAPPLHGRAPALLLWLRRVDGDGPWWLVLSAARFRSQGRRLAAQRLARRALSLLGPGAADEAGLVALCERLLGARGPGPVPGGQEPRARPSLRHSLAPR